MNVIFHLPKILVFSLITKIFNEYYENIMAEKMVFLLLMLKNNKF